jgi:hypothetical protein
MFRKVFTASIIGLMLSSTLVATSASAATISNGVLCPKVNKTTKVAGLVYKCIKAPTVNKTKLTWTSMDCINTNTSYLKSNAEYLSLAKQMPAVLAALDVKIAEAKTAADAAIVKADAADAKIVVLSAEVTKFTIARDAIPTNSTNPTIALKFKSAITTYNSAILTLKSQIASYTVASASYRKLGSTVATMQAVRAITVANLAQTKSGVAQTLSMRNLVCGKGL